MTLRPLHFASLALLTLLLLAGAAYYRSQTLKLTETEIIETYAARYLDTHPQADMTHCRARPGQGATRMVVICGPEPFDAARHYEYHVGPLGGLIEENGPGDWATKQPVAPRDAA
ncbi:hypothetical protein C8N43_1236 [Litoreibacter ponti]|uniref:Uncharacterized protein n=1 Tax=Litoreibacter ponti TaxID=1510457 RepID=A0A2T6BKI3_9RHOB|nr:hypothetical protein [Litoreibacter ponti]PTX56577.1 hypothetical protein C8N43_1236 [Litoreibacter ponti]